MLLFVKLKLLYKKRVLVKLIVLLILFFRYILSYLFPPNPLFFLKNVGISKSLPGVTSEIDELVDDDDEIDDDDTISDWNLSKSEKHSCLLG